jgi:hypothetical protein
VFQKRMGNGIGVLPRNAVEQQKFQHLMVIKVIQAFFQKAVFQALPMATMDYFILCHDFSPQKRIFLAIFDIFR